ncbi:MAG: AMP-binding protein [Desulfobacteraceae bacterium]|jgi:phenylacetate-coenzyme A ligase PaaK-like adenylate-forming protein
MTSLAITPLEAWNSIQMGLGQQGRPTPDKLARYQLDRLNATLNHVIHNSPFYQKLLKNTAVFPLENLQQLQTLPFTNQEALRKSSLQLLSVSQSRVARVVTLHTSGTTGTPKRFFFTNKDLERTIDFFHYGLMTMVSPGQRLLIFLPGDLPHSAGKLLEKAAERMDVQAIIYGLIQEPDHAIQTIIDNKINSLVGIPVQILSLIRSGSHRSIPTEMIESVLLSTDYVPQAIVKALKETWNCEVFQHYGMTEMGYGGAMSCDAHFGYHLREMDLLFEVIDPITLQPIDDHGLGEVVFTTLNHQAMPLIRYRTGDLAAWIKTPCPCGSILRRMSWVQGRSKGNIYLDDQLSLNIHTLDEQLFALPYIIDFQATLYGSKNCPHLQVTIFIPPLKQPDPLLFSKALKKIPALQIAESKGLLKLDPVLIEQGIGNASTVVKRKILDYRI